MLTLDQQDSITKLYEKNTLLVAKMGAGKTVIGATALTELLEDNVIERALIVTTPKIANTVWAQEFAKWQHTKHITVAAATGTPEQRQQVIKSGAQVVVVTFNVLPWMKQENLFKYFDGLLVDETTKLKTTGGEQFKAIRKALKDFKWRGGLTGTPVSEDFIGLFGQIMLIDTGETLGRNKQKFLGKYFYPTDYKQYNWELQKDADTEILKSIAPLVHVMPDYRDELPPIEYGNIYLTMPDKLRKYYDELRKDMVNDEVIAQNSAVLSQKLQQVASGFVYLEDGSEKRLSEYKLDALEDYLSNEPENVIVAYWYKADLEQLKKRFPQGQELTPRKLIEQKDQWNSGKIKLLFVHPRSAGHGLQLEQGGAKIIWLAPQWSNDLWEQTNARIWRKGQTHTCVILSIVARESVDELIVQRINNKAEYDKIFTKHLQGEL